LKRRLLTAYINLPTSHLLSHYPIVRLDDKLGDHLLWIQLIKALRADGDAKSAELVIKEVIEDYTKAIDLDGSGNRQLWVYSSYCASRGFDPFEPRRDLSHEVLWVMLAEAHEQLGQHKEAAEAIEKAVKSQPSNRWLWQKLSTLCVRGGDTERAGNAESKATRVNGEFSKQYYAF